MRELVVAFTSDNYVADGIRQSVCASCGGLFGHFETAVGFSLTGSGEVKWISVGCRCVACSRVYVDWKIDYEPSRQLLGRA